MNPWEEYQSSERGPWDEFKAPAAAASQADVRKSEPVASQADVRKSEPAGPSSRMAETSPDAIKGRAGQVGRVLLKTLASPFTLAARAANKVGLPQNDLEARVDELAGRMAPHQGFAEDVAKVAPAFALPGGFIPQVLGNAAIGAIEAPEGGSLQGGAVGGALGAGGSILAKALGAVRRGAKPTAEALEYQASGVPLTPGQLAPQGGWLNKAEDALASMPIVGTPIRNRRGDILADYQAALVDAASKGNPHAQAVLAKVQKLDANLANPKQFTPQQVLEAIRDIGAPNQVSEELARRAARIIGPDAPKTTGWGSVGAATLPVLGHLTGQLPLAAGAAGAGMAYGTKAGQAVARSLQGALTADEVARYADALRRGAVPVATVEANK